LLRMVSVCRASKVDCVYSDEWLFLRENPLRRLVFVIGARALGIRYVFDQRDPFIDFEVERGNIEEGSRRHKTLRFYYRLNYEFTDLAIFPSEAYAAEFSFKGLPERKKMGGIRGIDKKLFNPGVEGRGKRAELGLQDRFVVGWFGMMQNYRQIEEVVIPLIENAGKSIANVHFLIGGHGELSHRFVELKEDRPELDMTYLGFVPYDRLPEYLSACDVLLCTLGTAGRFSKYALPLKILESVAVGRPIIATKTEACSRDYKDLKGVVWTGSDYQDFMDSLTLVHANYDRYRGEAVEQALDFDRYTLESTISRIADEVERVCR
jgi:glycosyltransferase involved in cell wall biosynthesis